MDVRSKWFFKLEISLYWSVCSQVEKRHMRTPMPCHLLCIGFHGYKGQTMRNSFSFNRAATLSSSPDHWLSAFMFPLEHVLKHFYRCLDSAAERGVIKYKKSTKSTKIIGNKLTSGWTHFISCTFWGQQLLYQNWQTFQKFSAMKFQQLQWKWNKLNQQRMLQVSKCTLSRDLSCQILSCPSLQNDSSLPKTWNI